MSRIQSMSATPAGGNRLDCRLWPARKPCQGQADERAEPEFGRLGLRVGEQRFGDAGVNIMGLHGCLPGR